MLWVGPSLVELSMELITTKVIIHVEEEEDKQKMEPIQSFSISAEAVVVIVVESEDRPQVRMSQAPDSLVWRICWEEVATTIVAVIVVIHLTTIHLTITHLITIPQTVATINSSASATTT